MWVCMRLRLCVFFCCCWMNATDVITPWYYICYWAAYTNKIARQQVSVNKHHWPKTTTTKIPSNTRTNPINGWHPFACNRNRIHQIQSDKRDHNWTMYCRHSNLKGQKKKTLQIICTTMYCSVKYGNIFLRFQLLCIIAGSLHMNWNSVWERHNSIHCFFNEHITNLT